MEKGQNRVLKGYREIHHIIPKSEGGLDEDSNLVALTAREHFLAHWLLYRENPTTSRAHAFWRMCNGRGKVLPENWIIVPSRAYEEARLAHSKAISKALKGKSKTPEHIAKVAESNRGKKRTLKARNNMSIAAKKRGTVSGYYVAREKAWEINTKKTVMIDPETKEQLKSFNSLKEAAAYVNRGPSNISIAINKKTRSAGYLWKFKE